MRTSAETDTHDLARGAGAHYLGYLARLGARAPFLFIVGLLYGKDRFGEYTFGLTVIETTAAVALFGLKRSLFKFMSEAVAGEEEVDQAVANGVALALTLAAVLTLAVLAGAGPLAAGFRFPSAARVLRVLTPAIPLIVLSDILLVAIRFTRQMRFEVIARSVLEPIVLSVTVVAAYYGGARQEGLFIGYLASLAVAAGASAVFFARLFPVRAILRMPLRWTGMCRLVSFSGPTAGYDLLVLLAEKVDVFLVSYFFPTGVVGVYGMARQFTTFTKKIRQGFDRILPPVLSQAIAARNLGRARDQLALVSRWILSVQVLLLLAFAFFGREVLGLVGDDFRGGAYILTLLLIGEAINGSLGISELPIVYLRPSANLLVGAAMLVASLASGVWLTRRFGPEGTALSVVVTYVLVNALRLGLNRGLFRLTTLNASILKPVAAAGPALGAAWAVRRIVPQVGAAQLALGLPLLIGAYLGGLYLLGLEPEDRAQLRRLGRRSAAG